MRPAEILRAAKEKISDPARWCRKWFALDEFGCGTQPLSVTACKWCSVGAVRAAGGFVDSSDARHILRFLYQVIDGPSIVKVNDTGTHADVMAMFDRAIAIAESQELSGARSVE